MNTQIAMEEKTEHLQLETEIIKVLKEIFDPEIPINIYDLGLIYEINIDKENNVEIVMTLTAPGCPVAGWIVAQVQEKVESVEETKKVTVDLVFEPAWGKDNMSEEAMLELGFL